MLDSHFQYLTQKTHHRSFSAFSKLLCDARSRPMISAIVKPLSAQSVLLCKPARTRVAFYCHRRYSLCSGSSHEQGNRFLPVRVSRGIRAARARSQVYLSRRGLYRTLDCGSSVDWVRAYLSLSLSRRSWGTGALHLLNQ